MRDRSLPHHILAACDEARPASRCGCKALALIADPATTPAAAAEAATTEGEQSPAFAHQLAVAANTRGYRLYQDGKLDDAIPLFTAALNADVTYGMPRYNLSRVYARQGNAAQAAVYLRMLRIMGKAQRARLEQATKDEAFKGIADTDEFRAVSSNSPTDERGVSCRTALRSGERRLRS